MMNWWPLTPEQAVELWAPGMGVETAQWLVDGFRMMAEYMMTPESTVPDLTGRPAKPYREWAVENAEAFR